jgi:integrase
MCADMVTAKKRELRTREDNPCRDVKPPERGEKKGKQYLWPSEFLTLVTSPKVPLRWRQLFALAVYTYARAGELEALYWEDVDLEHRILHVHRATDRAKSKAHEKVTKSTKTGVARRLPIEPSLAPLLERLADQRAGRARVFAMPPHSALSLKLKVYLERAGASSSLRMPPARPSRFTISEPPASPGAPSAATILCGSSSAPATHRSTPRRATSARRRTSGRGSARSSRPCPRSSGISPR